MRLDEIKTPYTTEEVCAMLSIKPRTLRLYVKQGLLHPAKIGRRHLFSQEDIQGYLQAKGLTVTDDAERARRQEEDAVLAAQIREILTKYKPPILIKLLAAELEEERRKAGRSTDDDADGTA